jgi:hypothetical protein
MAELSKAQQEILDKAFEELKAESNPFKNLLSRILFGQSKTSKTQSK